MEWREAVVALARQVDEWVQAAGDVLGSETRTVISLEPIAEQAVLEIDIPGRARFYLEPALFAADQVPTIVHLYAYPSLRRVQLEGPKAGAWEVLSTHGIPMRYQWNSHDFLRLLAELADEPISRVV